MARFNEEIPHAPVQGGPLTHLGGGVPAAAIAGQQILMHQHQGKRFMQAPAMEGMGLVEDRAEVDPQPGPDS